MEKAQIENFKKLFIEILSEEDIAEGKLLPQSEQGDEMDQLLQEKENQLGFRLQARNAIYLKKVRKVPFKELKMVVSESVKIVDHKFQLSV